ncbi:MAG: MarR family transcriptional regulator [Candidatus Hodarchaeales archaeon]|jgi:DNA-binding MarR family transcriptional regulator
MPDILFFIDLGIKILLLTVFFNLFIIQLYQMKNRPMQSKFFTISMLMGTIGFVILVIDTILWEVNPIKENRIAFHVIIFVLLQVYAYFWYLHYEAIISVAIPKIRNFPLLFLAALSIIITVLYFIGVNLGLSRPLSDLWSYLGISTHPGRVVTIVSHIAFLVWVSVCTIALYIIITSNLIELRKISTFELISIAIQLITTSFLLLEDLFITFSVYDRDMSNMLITIGLLVLFLGLLSLLLNYLLFDPPHVQSPSIQLEYYEKLQNIFSGQAAGTNNERSDSISASAPALAPKKLPSTALFILIHILNSNNSTSYARAIEENLNLSKSTVSYNLNLLENEYLIERKMENLQEDQRFKVVILRNKGMEYLLSVYLQLEKHFKL